MLVFTNSLADFANPQLLAGSLKVLSTEAYMIVTGRMNDLGRAMLSFLALADLDRIHGATVLGRSKELRHRHRKPSTTLADLTSKRVRTVLSVVTIS